MKILITGANGFVGSRLFSYLSNYHNYSVFGLQRDNKKKADGHYIYVDFSEPNWQSLLPDTIDVVIHLAQSSHYRSFPEKSNDIFAINILTTFELLEWARVHNVKKFIFSSTGNVYAPQKKILIEEDPCEPSSMYAASKLCSEHLLKQYTSFFDVFILRLFSIYGPSQQGMLIPSVIDKILKKQTITLANNQGLYLTPLFIDDCINMIQGIINLPRENSLMIANLAGDEIFSLADIISTIVSILDSEPIIEVVQGNVPWLCGNNHKITNILGFGPKIFFKDGIRKTLQAWR
jgi:nucleoside-diphosphate-sugar epimerase